ncbi:uncharacterized protein LY89DRAFT_740042 [Mollisia scopiformis]|uniref:Uncharacterized protein n=1 Tax=Mollisia scopiformis TaxID=149040 RepID=A0A132BEN7_MOLSC|nr:uncharacterized protein LY89DRAFT_740042 [Mollisia scopiformis]KUJ10314.1 hypothetical protein LY89DRAFT_740042 [Mollisia scopiformis]
MAFESSTLVNGAWTTRTFDVNTALRHFDQQDKDNAANQMAIETTPKLGLLTQTVVRSPLVHWILPVRLRDNRIHDVAFIGDDFVQIKELRSDGLLWDVIRKEDFGARIRNAAVIGSVTAYEQDPDAMVDTTQVKSEGDASDTGQPASSYKSESSATSSRLPPQFLVLQLETGDTIFLMLQTNGSGQPRFVASTYRVSKAMLRCQPGVHIAVDPSSRYMAVGCSEGTFAIYKLQTRATLKQQFSEGKKLQHISQEMHMPAEDSILQLQFLYPPPGNDCQDCIILVALVIRKHKTRILVYEWDAGDAITRIKPKSIKGHLLDDQRQMPLLLIPLVIRSSFVLVYEDFMAVCEGMVSNTPKFTINSFHPDYNESTPFHNGVGSPLWTSWARPFRHKIFLEHSDNIFVAREDGLIKLLHFNNGLNIEHNNIGQFFANCGTSFASLEFEASDHKSGDLLVMGGDGCSGGTYLLQARKLPILTEPIQNWTPAQDIVTTYVSKTTKAYTNGNKFRAKEVIPNPDQIFVCAGKGIKATITEIRQGLEARIGLETEYDTPVLKVWALPSDFEEVEDYDASLFLLSLGDASAVLTLSGDASDIGELDESCTKFNLRSRTIVVTALKNLIVQVTEKAIRVIGGDFLRDYKVCDLPGIVGTNIDNAALNEKVVIFTTYVGNSVHLQVLEHGLFAADMDLDESTTVRTLCTTSTNITSLLVGEISQTQFAIAAEWSESSLRLTFQSIQGEKNHNIDLLDTFADFRTRLDAVASLAMISRHEDTILLLCGTRNGFLITLAISTRTFEIAEKRIDRIGATSVILTADEHPNRENSFFISCDGKLHYLQPVLTGHTGSSTRTWCKQAHSIHQIWLSDAADPSLRQPSITTFAQLRQSTSPTSRLNESLLLVSGSTLFLADLSIQPKVVPRHILIGGTPTRLLYSHSLNALVVGMTIDGKSTLKFMDPETGEDLSQAVARDTHLPVEFIAGLGHLNERIFRLFEWAYVKDHKTWNYIIVATNQGRVLIITAQVSDDDTNGNTTGKSRPRIKYYARHRFRSTDPVYSVAGFPEGLLWCAGTKIYCEVLDQTEKRFVRTTEYDLPSPAINMEYSDGTIYALTESHSLEMLTLDLNEDEGSMIVRTHGDQLTRDGLHHTELQTYQQTPLHLVSDKSCSLVGLWPITNTKADTLDTVFEAELAHSIVRFRSAKCRPIWDDSWVVSAENETVNDSRSNGYPSSQMNQPETLGLSIMGSLSHFTVLQLQTWNYLRFLTDLAIRSPVVCEFTHKDTPLPLGSVFQPKLRMHIDGDILKRCLVGRHLEELLLIGQDTPEATMLFDRFCNVLRGHHGVNFVENAHPEEYLEQAYADLNYFLRPVM